MPKDRVKNKLSATLIMDTCVDSDDAFDAFLRLAWCMSPCWKHLQSCSDIRSHRPGNFKDMGMGQHGFDSTHQPTW